MGLQNLLEIDKNALIRCGLTAQAAFVLLTALNDVLQGSERADTPQLWRLVTKYVLRPDHPFEAHQLLFAATYRGWDAARRGPPPVWSPTPQGAAATNAARFMADLAARGDAAWAAQRPTGDPLIDFPVLQRWSVADPEGFWAPVLRALRVKFHVPPARILDNHPTDPDAVRWLPGARLNAAEAALAGHDPDAPAVLWAAEESPERVHSVTRGELARRAQHVADALRAWGVAPGAAVAVALPMGPDAVAAFLGIVLAGAAAVSIAESFSAREIESRLRVAGAVAVITQDAVPRGGKALPLYSRVVEAGAPRAVVLAADGGGAPAVQLRGGDLGWEGFLGLAPPPAPPLEPGGPGLRAHVADAYDVSGILFSSGTTGDPKAIPWTHVTPLRAAANAFFHQDVRPGDAVAWPTSMGWMMGPWLVYAALFNGAAVALFGGAPLGRPFGRFVSAARVAVLGLVPSVARAWRVSGCMDGLDWAPLRCFSSTGEASAPEEYLWLSSCVAGYRPVIEYCGGTEIGGAFLSGSMLQPQAPAAFSTATVGARPVLLLGGGAGGATDLAAAPAGAAGELALVMPQLGASQRLLNADHAAVYFDGMPAPGLRRHGDEVEALGGGGYARARGRVDDAMNLGGIKVGSVELERAVAGGVAAVAEAAAVGVPPPGGGPDRLVLFLVLREGGGGDAKALAAAAQAAIAARLNPLFKVAGVRVVAALPRTATGKVMRRVLRDAVVREEGGGGGRGGGAPPAAKL